MLVNGIHYRTIWMEGSMVRMIDQAILPFSFAIFDSMDHLMTAHAIRTMVIRGAGAIGAAGGYGVAQAALEAPSGDFSEYVMKAALLLKSTRPTAQNLFYAVDRVLGAVMGSLKGQATRVEEARTAAVREAVAVAEEDTQACRKIGEAGARLIGDGTRVLTHCNAGWLGFSDWGTALAPLYWAKREGKKPFVWVDETRPRLQGARLTAWELAGEGIEFRIIADNAAGFFMRRKEVDLVIVGSDRIAANGDVANKIGTYEKALLSRENGVPFYVAAPLSTVDLDCPNGDAIPIEERDQEEVLTASGPDEAGEIRTVRIAAAGAEARNPAFDVTPAELVSGIVTEFGIVRPKGLRRLISKRAGRSPSYRSG
jgi:methylthioribose-1-phosphate isomerase